MADKNKSLPQWIVQLLAWITGVGGIVLDYGLDLMHGHNLPFAYYAVCIGIGFGIDPSFIIKLFANFASTLKQTNDETKKDDK